MRGFGSFVNFCFSIISNFLYWLFNIPKPSKKRFKQ